jgi:hypothetical protein
MNKADLPEQLVAWVEQGIITSEQASMIAAFEAGQSVAAPPAETSPTRRIPLVVEALGYLGGVLVLGALVALLVPSWDILGRGTLAVIAGLVSLSLLVAGWVFAATAGAQSRRLGHFLLFLGVVVGGVFFGVVNDIIAYEHGPVRGTLLVTGGALVLSLVTWLTHRTVLQLIAVTLSLAGVIASMCDLWLGASRWLVAGLLYVVLGVLHILAAELDRLKPKAAAWDLGALAIIAGLQVVTFDDWRHHGWLLFLSCVLSAGLLALGLWRNRGVGLAVGAVGLVVFIPETLYWVFRDSMGVSAALLVAGVLLVGMSVFLITIRPRMLARRDG